VCLARKQCVTAILALGAILFSCNTGSRGHVADERPSARSGSVHHSPTVREEFRPFHLQTIPEALALLDRSLAHPNDVAAREALAELYQDGGFVGTARFYENTVRTLRSQPLLSAPVESRISWQATDLDLSDRPYQEAMEVAGLTAQAKYDEAVLKAQSTIEAEGASLRLGAQWADAVLWKAVWNPEEVSKSALEIAIRVFVSSLEERSIPMPIGIDNKAAGYERLSDVFARLNDGVAALTAVELALHHLPRPVREEWDKATEERLRSRLKSISSYLETK